MIIELSERHIKDLLNGEELMFKEGPVIVMLRRLPVFDDNGVLE